ncbi:hypothetical protein [Ferruginibacter profundus]
MATASLDTIPFKSRALQVAVAYIAAGIICILYALRYVTECQAHWAHDIYITITPVKIITGAVLLLLVPGILLFIIQLLQIRIPLKLFVINLFIVMILLLLVAAVVKRAGHNNPFIFISFTTAMAYYLLQAKSWIMFCMLVIKSISAIAGRKTTTPS